MPQTQRSPNDHRPPLHSDFQRQVFVSVTHKNQSTSYIVLTSCIHKPHTSCIWPKHQTVGCSSHLRSLGKDHGELKKTNQCRKATSRELNRSSNLSAQPSSSLANSRSLGFDLSRSPSSWRSNLDSSQPRSASFSSFLLSKLCLWPGNLRSLRVGR